MITPETLFVTVLSADLIAMALAVAIYLIVEILQ